MAVSCTESCTTKLTELESQLQRVQIELDAAKEERDELQREHENLDSKLREQLIDLNRKIKEYEKENRDLKEKVESQRKYILQSDNKQAIAMDEIKSLKEKVCALEKINPTLYVAEAAARFQQTICCAVLPETFGGDEFATIKQLVQYLTGEIKLPSDVSDDLGVAKKQWKEICKVFQWTDWDYKDWKYDTLPDEVKAIITLKQKRTPIAHPKTIELKTAMQYIPEIKVPEHKRKHIRKLFGSMQDKMPRIGLYHEGIEELRIHDSDTIIFNNP